MPTPGPQHREHPKVCWTCLLAQARDAVMERMADPEADPLGQYAHAAGLSEAQTARWAAALVSQGADADALRAELDLAQARQAALAGLQAELACCRFAAERVR